MAAGLASLEKLPPGSWAQGLIPIPRQLAFLFAKLFLWAMPKKKRTPELAGASTRKKTWKTQSVENVTHAKRHSASDYVPISA
ncbi:MAG: hypothetical protein Q8P02_01180 [Candidatus Micrarchaeota archaeon]|nr:hypothetical protein [Candidatus Micrarchaeota archaeon]